MRAFSIFILLAILSFACSKKDTAPEVVPTQLGAGPTYLALGDSYTIGQSVAQSDRFPAQTVALLQQENIKISEPVYLAQTGWTTANLQGAIAAANLAPQYDLVSLLIGVNDQYQGMDTAGYAIRFTQLLQTSIALAGGRKERVFVVSIPDYSVTPFVPQGQKQTVSREIDLFNAVNKRISESYGVSYTDITPSSREGATNKDHIANDQLHPSGLEYQKWAAMLAPKFKKALE